MSRVAVLQMTSSENLDHNLQEVQYFVKKAKEQGADLIVLPENFAFVGKQQTDKLKIAEILGQGKIQTTIAKLAKQQKIWIIAGTIPIYADDERVYASCLVFDAIGECVARYDKIHLFDVIVSEDEIHRESATIARGHSLVVVNTPVGQVGLSVCYDLRFPELFQQLLLKGAELFAIPSAFTASTGKAHWSVLLRARAIENLCYILAPNQEGKHPNGRTTYGHSGIIDPWGNLLNELQKGAGLIIDDIDLDYLHKLRQRFPCNEHHVLINN